MNPPTQEKKSKTTIYIAIAAAVFLVGTAFVCCGLPAMGALFFKGAEKAYYAECEQTRNPTDCASCCRSYGHNGYSYGAVLNEDGKLCGCL